MNETVIVGGGLAGGAAATLLARAGRQVHLIERDVTPGDKVCGEFLSPEAQHVLASVGVDLDRLGAAPIDTLRLVRGDRTIEVALPFVARGLSRRRLDTALLDRAAAAGARINRGVSVRAVAGGSVATGSGEIAAQTLLLASGKHEVRGVQRDTAGCDTGLVGFKSHWRLPSAVRAKLAGKVDVILFDGGYAGLQCVEGGVANLCLLVSKRRLATLGGSWDGLWRSLLTEPHVERMLGDAEQVQPRPLTIAGVPYGYRQPDAARDAMFRLGDQAAVIPSFCGEGMAIALHSAATAAAIILAGGTAADHRARLRRDLDTRLRMATMLHRAGRTPWSRWLLWRVLSAKPALARSLASYTRITR